MTDKPKMIKIRYIKRRKVIAILVVVTLVFYLLGLFAHLFEKSYDLHFQYPLEANIEESVVLMKNGEKPLLTPINSYIYKYTYDVTNKCEKFSSIRLVYLIKSAMPNFQRRAVIRKTWGYEKRFSDVNIVTLFLLGQGTSSSLQNAINEEFSKFGDIIQGNFTDTYFNNTLKTMMAMHWSTKYCNRSDFYFLVDDDYYVSTKNLLRYFRDPINYPQYLQHSHLVKASFENELSKDVTFYSGYVFKSTPHRHVFSKWYVSLEEYAYDYWPPYVTAGAVVLSNNAVLSMYYASYFTQHFRFDDIYLALLAKKMNIIPFHCDEFYFYTKPYSPDSFKFTLASHGYGNSGELFYMWQEQKSLGNA